MSDITSANAIVTLVVPDVFPAPIQLQGFAVDDAFATEEVEPAEVRLGVDGFMSAGFTPFTTKIKFTFQPDSPSISFFDAWLGAEKALFTVFFADATITLPSLPKTFICTKGVLSGAMQFPPGKKVLDPVSYTITFEDVQPANI